MLRLDSPTPDELRIHGPKFDEDGVVVEKIHGDPDTAITHTQTVDENHKDSGRDDSARDNEGGPTDDKDVSGEKDEDSVPSDLPTQPEKKRRVQRYQSVREGFKNTKKLRSSHKRPDCTCKLPKSLIDNFNTAPIGIDSLTQDLTPNFTFRGRKSASVLCPYQTPCSLPWSLQQTVQTWRPP
ncbi:hypothetical protein N7488_008067 [Penicillium malachiteum]|nr:hypothetical protein N7488_008067 [Penicillium malachiteum]